jgi:hypothetical protein
VAGGLAHRFKFALWDFARLHPALAKPIRWAGAKAMQGADDRLRARLGERLASIMPPDDYARPHDVPAQAWILEDGADQDDLLGAALLLNHLRVPFRKGPLSALEGAAREQTVLVLDPSSRGQTGLDGDFQVLAFTGGAGRLLPHRDGLRSDFAAAILGEIRRGARRPLLLGLAPPEAALRIDDIRGLGIEDWLTPMLAHGWRPNLGLFLDAFAEGSNPCASWLAELAKDGLADITPHAFAENDLIYFDLPWGRPYGEREFLARWSRAEEIMARNGFPLSATLNPHFHVLGRRAAEILAGKGAHYWFGEFALDTQDNLPDAGNWPSGDPLHCTGRLDASGIFQLCAGDNMATLMNKGSIYDFLMQIKTGDVERAAERAIRRLSLSLACGFPAYLIVHEFMLCQALDRKGHETLWPIIDRALPKAAKVSMNMLGARFRARRLSRIQSVASVENGLSIGFTGENDGHDSVRLVLPGGRERDLDVPAYGGSFTMALGL